MTPIPRSTERGPIASVGDGARLFPDVFRLRAESTPDAPANYQKVEGAWRATTWREFYDQARAASAGLVDLGLEVGDRVAILGPTQPEWGVWDLGTQLAGGVSIGIYPHQSVEQVSYLLEHSESRVVFVDGGDELATVLAAAAGNGHLRAIVPWTEDLAARHAEDDLVMSPARFRDQALAEEVISERLASVEPDDSAILIYTSGTTGPPKGAMITHANILALLNAHSDVLAFDRGDLLFSFLPMAHATERVLAFYLRINTGLAAAYASSIGAVLAEVREVAPTIFGSVPRLYEKVFARVHSEIGRKPAVVRSLFAWACKVGRQRLPYLLEGRAAPFTVEMKYRIAHRLVFAKIHAAFGGRVRLCLAGAAPISPEILEFFWGAGLPIFEAYGMTEATVLTHTNRQARVRLGSVGQVVQGNECRIASDGEILIRGPIVFKGYYKNEAATAETVVDGWLHSGDIGELDEDGFLRITDRKKHLIITAGGKNVAPANIERAIKTKSPMISQMHAHGDRRHFIVALIAPSPLETLAWGAEHGILPSEEVAERTAELEKDPTSRSPALDEAMGKVASTPEFQQLFVEPVENGNRDLARVERVGRFYVLDRDFSIEGGEMTPTMKMKRKAIEEKYSEIFDRIYNDDSFALTAGRE